MSFYNKKYYKQRYNEVSETNEKLKAENFILRDSIRFLMQQTNVHAVKYEPVHTHWGASDTRTEFEYVDATGKYHSIIREFKYADLACVSASAEAAVFVYAREDKATYWLLNKADELFAEIPEMILCTKNKTCEKETENE